VEYSANGAKRAALDDACGSCRDGITVGFPLLDYDKVRDKALGDELFKDMVKSCIDVYTGEAAPTFNRQGVWSRVRCGVTAYKDVRRYSGADFKKAFGYTPEELNMPKYRIKDETGKDVQQVVLADEDAPGARMRVWYEMVNDKEDIAMRPDTCLRGTQADEVMKWLQEKEKEKRSTTFVGVMLPRDVNARIEKLLVKQKQAACHDDGPATTDPHKRVVVQAQSSTINLPSQLAVAAKKHKKNKPKRPVDHKLGSSAKKGGQSDECGDESRHSSRARSQSWVGRSRCIPSVVGQSAVSTKALHWKRKLCLDNIASGWQPWREINFAQLLVHEESKGDVEPEILLLGKHIEKALSTRELHTTRTPRLKESSFNFHVAIVARENITWPIASVIEFVVRRFNTVYAATEGKIMGAMPCLFPRRSEREDTRQLDPHIAVLASASGIQAADVQATMRRTLLKTYIIKQMKELGKAGDSMVEEKTEKKVVDELREKLFNDFKLVWDHTEPWVEKFDLTVYEWILSGARCFLDPRPCEDGSMVDAFAKLKESAKSSVANAADAAAVWCCIMKSPWLVCIADELSTCLASEMELGATFHGLNKLLEDCGDEFQEQLEALNVAVEKLPSLVHNLRQGACDALLGRACSLLADVAAKAVEMPYGGRGDDTTNGAKALERLLNTAAKLQGYARGQTTWARWRK